MNMENTKKKICVSAFGDPYDPKVWSGTPARIMKYLGERNDIELESINLKKMSGLLYKFFLGVGKIFYRRGTLRDPLIYRIEADRFARKSHEKEADIFLFVAEHTINEKRRKNAKYYLYLDSLLRPYFEYDERKMKPTAKWFLRKYEHNDRQCFLCYDAIMTQNQWAKDFLIEEYGIPEEKIHNIGFGVNVEYYNGPKDYSKKQLMTVLRRGTEYIKGLFLLLDAFKIMHDVDQDIKLAVFGTTLDPMDGVTYYEECPRDVMINIYRESTLYVMPNVLEPNGITYLEALANKTPIVGLDRFAVPEFSGYGEYGFVAEADAERFASTVLDALCDLEKLKIMGEKGQAFVKGRYAWNSVMDEMLSIINA